VALIKRSPAKIYHYRAGYGHKSVKVAKSMGMLTLCDHSIAHPGVLEYLVSNNGHLPKKQQEIPISIFWRNILDDINQADHILVNSDFVKDTFIHQGFDSKRIHVIYLGLDDEFMEAILKSTCKNKYGKVIRFAFAGEFSQRKGADLIVQTLQRINDLDWQLEIAGGINPVIRKRYSTFFADPRVNVVGYVSRAKLAECLTNVDIFVFPSLAEGSARVIFEALACGCYVITTPNSGSIVEDGIHGALVPPDDVDALEKAMRQTFMMDRKKIAYIGANNAAHIQASFKQKDYGESLLQLYESLLNENTS
jgi:glycosyltransferase involved in cell wall biosynthesis